MKQDSNGTYHEYEYKVALRKKLSPNQLKNIVLAIKKSPLFHRSYKYDDNTWYELRSPKNQNIHNEPDASLLIGSDYIYIMRETKDVWENLEALQSCIEQDLEQVLPYVS